MRKKNIIKKLAAAVISAVTLFSGAAVLDHSDLQPNAIVAEAAYDDGVILKAKKGERVYLKQYQLYYSPLKNYVCIFQGDGNLVVYRYRSWKGFDNSAENAVWASGTYGNPNAECCLQADGNLVIYNTDKYGYKHAIFHTHTHSDRDSTAYLCLSRNGNLRVQHGNTIKWQSHKADYGKSYRAPEPACVKLVGEWKANNLWNAGTITIDFPDDQTNYMKVTLNGVSGLQNGNATGKVTGFINADEITGSSATFTIYKAEYDYTDETEVPGSPLVKVTMSGDGEKLSHNKSNYKRFTTKLPTSQYR